MLNTLRSFSLCLLASLAIACSSSAADESEVLISLTDAVIVPGYEATAAASSELRETLEGLCASPTDDSLSTAQQAWRDTRAPLMRSEATWFGPFTDRRSEGLLAWPQTDSERIEAMLVNNPATTQDGVRDGLASTQRGLGAIEYLLFAPNALELLSDSSSVRCQFLIALGQVVESEMSGILADWKGDGNVDQGYGGFFTGRSSIALVEGQAIAEVVRTQVFLIRTLVVMRLAAALGLREGGPDLSAIPGGNGDNSLYDLRNEVLGMRDMYIGPEGDEGMGISDLVQALSTETDERMRQHFTSSLEAIDAVGMPLREAISERPEQVQAVHDRLRELQVTLNTEVVSLLGVSVGFSDTDGDSMR